ncbi:MAG TPA: hypothetical protein VEY12_11550 [Thermoplasmata archaeon]|nr:hypothetical protein [Thermoplasmata archaeon]
MDSTQTLLLLVVVPVVAWVASLLVLHGAYQEIQRDWLAGGRTPPFSRIVVASVYGAVPVLFGLSLWFLSLPFVDTLNSMTSSAAADAEQLLQWVSVTTAVAACCTVAGQTIVVRGRLSSYLGSDFGRVLPISVIPFTDMVFVLVLAVFAFRYVHGVAQGGIPAGAAAVGSAVSAFQAYAVASVAIPVSAAVSNRGRDLSARGFVRALMIADLGELPVILGLVLGFLAIGGL